MNSRQALLLTDVVDSTRIAENLGAERNGALWDDHDRVARALVARHDGFELERTDGIGVVFDAVENALAFALAYHQATAALTPPLSVRAVLQVGDLTVRQNPADHVARGAKALEVDGLGVALAARMLSVARGGQTLLSGAAREALGATALRLVSHGHWRFKGVSEPVELFEIGNSDAGFTPPADAAKAYRVVRSGEVWLPVQEIRHSLPAERDAFVGRTADLRALGDRIDAGARLVSVIGMGGTGKTRLVTRFARAWLGDFPGGAWFCDLSDARGPGDIHAAVARALDVPLGKDDAVGQLGHAISGRGRCLLVLDNFEQVARWAPETLGRWLDRAPDAAFVVTTREVLGLPGELALPLAPLPPPDAVALFVARAQFAKPGFLLSPSEQPAVEALVRLLDALPLAIELAAARVRVMPIAALVERMSERFRLLSSPGGRHSRQATLRATLDWSWDLLTADEQAGLAQLSVFEGGFTLEGAEAVLALPDAWPVDAVQGLVDKSLVRRLTENRLDLLVSVQEYAAEKLVGFGAAAATEARHGAWCAARGTEDALDSLHRAGGVARRRDLERELDNVVAACRRAVARGDGPIAAATARAAAAVFLIRGPASDGAAWLRAARALPTVPPEQAIRIDLALAVCLQRAGQTAEAESVFQRVLRDAEAGGRTREEAVACIGLARLKTDTSPGDSARFSERAVALAQAAGDPGLEADAFAGLAWASQPTKERDTAGPHFERALQLYRALGNREGEGNVLANLAVHLRLQGRSEESHTALVAALAIHREVGNRVSEAIVLEKLGQLCAQSGPIAEAGALYDQSLAVARDVGNRPLMCGPLGGLADWHRRFGRAAEATAAFEAVIALARELRQTSHGVVQLCQFGVHLAEQGDVARARACVAEAAAWGPTAVGTFLGSLCLSRIERAEGHLDASLDHARNALEAARSLAAPNHVACLCELAIVHLARGELPAARRCVAEASTHPISSFPGQVALTEALVCLAERDLAAADRALARAVDHPNLAYPHDEPARRLALALAQRSALAKTTEPERRTLKD